MVRESGVPEERNPTYAHSKAESPRKEDGCSMESGGVCILLDDSNDVRFLMKYSLTGMEDKQQIQTAIEHFQNCLMVEPRETVAQRNLAHLYTTLWFPHAHFVMDPQHKARIKFLDFLWNNLLEVSRFSLGILMFFRTIQKTRTVYMRTLNIASNSED